MDDAMEEKQIEELFEKTYRIFGKTHLFMR